MSNVRDESLGVTKSPRQGAEHAYGISKKNDPVTFRNAMLIHWLHASLFVGAGLFFRHILKKQDSLDPLAPDKEE